MDSILTRMEKSGVKQVDLLRELRKRGFTVNPPELSNTLRGLYLYPKSKAMLEECEKILAEYET